MKAAGEGRGFLGALGAFGFEMKQESDQVSKTPNSQCFEVTFFRIHVIYIRIVIYC